MNLGELEISSKEIDRIVCHFSMKYGHPFREFDLQELVTLLHTDLNADLKAKVGKCTELFGVLSEDGDNTIWGPPHSDYADSHKGRLVCIEEIKK